MYAEKRKARVRHRVDQPSDHLASLWAQDIVVAAEGNDLWSSRCTGHLGNAVGIETSTTNHIAGLDETRGGYQMILTIALVDGSDLGVRQNLSTMGSQLVCIGPGDPDKIHDAGGGRVERFYSNHAWLKLTQAFRTDHLQSRHAIRQATL